MPSSLPNPIQLVGSQQVINSANGVEPLLHFYGEHYARLTKEVRHTGDLTRYVGFQSSAGGDNIMHFFGIEVNKIDAIPAGLIAWELSERNKTIWENQAGRDVIVSQEGINWQWLSPLSAIGERYTGEFTCHANDGDHPYWISTNAYVGLHETDVSNDEILLVDYDPAWPEQFAEMAQWLYEALGEDIILRAEHYGSTAIPGIPAKPIIDILVEVPSFAEAKPRFVPLLNNPQWEYWWTSEHMLFIQRDKLMGQRTHHIHLATAGHVLWQGIPFRDYLRNHPQDAKRYAALKQALAQQYRDDRERYTEAKTDFVQEILSRINQK